MRAKLAIGSVVIAGLAIGYVLVNTQERADAAPAKNLKVLKKGMDKKKVKAIMKRWTKALGVDCEYCHGDAEKSKDTRRKRKTRQMVRMTNRINRTHLRKYKKRISCRTCHRGKRKPKM